VSWQITPSSTSNNSTTNFNQWTTLRTLNNPQFQNAPPLKKLLLNSHEKKVAIDTIINKIYNTHNNYSNQEAAPSILETNPLKLCSRLDHKLDRLIKLKHFHQEAKAQGIRV